MPINLHICLVSDQLLANYIPVMMDQPDQVHLVSSGHMVGKGMTARFSKMLEGEQFAVIQHDDMPDHGIADICQYAEELWEKINAEIPDVRITLNITGGNKLMTIAMWTVFNGVVDKIIYTDTFHHCIENLHDQSKHPLKSVLDIPRYLQAHGVKYINAVSDNGSWLEQINTRKIVSKHLAENAESLGNFIGTLNFLASNALSKDGKNLEEPIQNIEDLTTKRWRDSLLMLQKHQLLAWDGNREITFHDAERARYLGGIWLEEYVYHIAHDANPDHVASSVKINWGKSRNTTNELDVVLVHNNRMLVIECKTLRFGNNHQKDSDMIYKISNLGDELSGLYGKVWLVSARSLKPHVQARAKTRSLQLKGPTDLKNLRQHIINWMDNNP